MKMSHTLKISNEKGSVRVFEKFGKESWSLEVRSDWAANGVADSAQHQNTTLHLVEKYHKSFYKIAVQNCGKAKNPVY